MSDLLRQKLMKALTHTLSAEAEEVEESEELEEPAPVAVEVLTADGLPPDPADERARVAASVAAVLLTNHVTE